MVTLDDKPLTARIGGRGAGTTAPPAAILGVVVANSVPERALSIGFGVLLLVVAYQDVRNSPPNALPPDDAAAAEAAHA